MSTWLTPSCQPPASQCQHVCGKVGVTRAIYLVMRDPPSPLEDTPRLGRIAGGRFAWKAYMCASSRMEPFEVRERLEREVAESCTVVAQIGRWGGGVSNSKVNWSPKRPPWGKVHLQDVLFWGWRSALLHLCPEDDQSSPVVWGTAE